MSYIKDEIFQASQTLSLNIREIPYDEAFLYKKILAEKFSTDPHDPLILSDQNMIEASSYCDDNAWKLIEEFISSMSPIILFLNPDEDLYMFEVPTGKDLTNLLGECKSFPFYVSAKPFDFLISLDDIECMSCTGSAKEWGESLRKNRPR